jgi:hypothetical protein
MACQYFDVADMMIRLEDEAYRCAARPRRRARIRNRHGFSSTSIRPPVGTGVGVTAVVLIEVESGECHVVLHRRSADVATNPGVRGTIPTFGLEPSVGDGYSRRQLGLLEVNILREMLEELYDLDHLVKASSSRHVASDWFLDRVSSGGRLVELFDDGKVTIVPLGWCVDLVNGVLDLNVLVRIAVPSINDPVVSSMVANWEAAGKRVGAASVETLELSSVQLTRECLSHMFHWNCALAVKQTRDLLRDSS